MDCQVVSCRQVMALKVDGHRLKNQWPSHCRPRRFVKWWAELKSNVRPRNTFFMCCFSCKTTILTCSFFPLQLKNAFDNLFDGLMESKEGEKEAAEVGTMFPRMMNGIAYSERLSKCFIMEVKKWTILLTDRGPDATQILELSTNSNYYTTLLNTLFWSFVVVIFCNRFSHLLSTNFKHLLLDASEIVIFGSWIIMKWIL